MKNPAHNFPFRRCGRFSSGATLALLLGLLPAPMPGGQGADSVQRFKDDVRFLSGKMLPTKYRVRRQAGGEDIWAALQDQIERLKRVVENMQDLGEQIDATESRLHYLKNFEVEPKMREVERVRLLGEQRLESVVSRLRSLDREIKVHNAKPHVFTKEQAAAHAAYDNEAARLASRQETLRAERDRIMAETQQAFEQAVEAVAKVQQEMSETGAKHGRLATEFGEVAGLYAAIRDPLAGRLQDIENQPEATVVTTPFGGNSVPAGQAGTLARPAPIGAGVTPRALDQLRIVTATSNTAADTRDDRLGVGPVTTSMVSGYQFDTKQGLPPVDLPAVAAPEGVPVDMPAPEPAAVPLVLAPSPTQQPGAPAEIKASPRLQQAEQEQTRQFDALEKLYAERKQLAQQGPAASAQDWTRVVNQISATQAQINFTEGTKRLSAGSKAVDLTIRPKSRSTTDIVVPPSGTPSP
ncbi:MAG: hypothetical protein HYV95_04510 [Opitutae bacterium]|nr:hypothetical protein [Opitutae bacterium]